MPVWPSRQKPAEGTVAIAAQGPNTEPGGWRLNLDEEADAGRRRARSCLTCGATADDLPGRNLLRGRAAIEQSRSTDARALRHRRRVPRPPRSLLSILTRGD